MNICFISPSLLNIPPLFGGAIETFTYELGLSLAKLNNKVIIITRNRGDQKPIIKPNLTIYPLKIPANRLIRGFFYNIQIIRKLLTIKTIDILHTQGTAIFPSAYFLSKLLKVPIIHTEHVYTPWISTPSVSLFKRIKYPLDLFLGKFMLSRASKIVVATDYIKSAMQKIKPEAISNFEIVPQGINQDIFNPTINKLDIRRKYNLSSTDKVILYVGRIAPEKKIDLLIKTFGKSKKHFPNLKLLLAGPKMSIFPSNSNLDHYSTYFLELEKWIQENNLQNEIIFTDAVPYNKIPQYYAGSNIFVQPSPLETFGRSIFEAAAVGIPFICSQIGKISLDYLPKSSGIFIKKMNITKLHAAICKILNNEEVYKENGMNESKKIHRSFNWVEIAKEYLKIYKKVVKKGKN